MSVEPSEWHSFGDPPERENSAKPQAAASSAAPQRLSGAESHRNAWLAVGFTIIAVVVGVAVFVTTVAMAGGTTQGDVVIASRSDPTAGGAAETLAPEASDPKILTQTLLVDIEGAVRSPGLHQVPAGSRIGDAITVAGGYADRADLSAAALTLNLAEPLSDGSKIRVPLLGEGGGSLIESAAGQSPAATNGGQGPGTGLIDLNHADETALDSLPGVGPVTAGKIIAARASGPFSSLDEVVSRKALTASVLDKIRPLVTVTP